MDATFAPIDTLTWAFDAANIGEAAPWSLVVVVGLLQPVYDVRQRRHSTVNNEIILDESRTPICYIKTPCRNWESRLLHARHLKQEVTPST